MDDERVEWAREGRRLLERVERHEARRRGRRQILTSDFARATAASVLGTVLGAAVLYVLAVVFGAIQGFGAFGVALLVTAFGALLFAIGYGVWLGPAPTLAEQDFYRLWQHGKRRGWVPEEPDASEED